MNLYSLPFFFIVSLFIFSVWFFEFKTSKRVFDPILYFVKTYKYWNILFLITTLVLNMVIHELLHGITWSFFCKNKFKSIKFGVIWKSLIPYCNCKEPLNIRHYKLGAIMPFIILGVLPLLASILTKNILLLLFSYLSIISTSGDLIIFYLLMKETKNCKILDHPTKIGYIKVS